MVDPIRCVAIYSPGDMGHSIGRELRRSGLDVIACTAGRSQRTQALSRAAELREVSTLTQLVSEADLLLSILVPSQALPAAGDLADAIRETASRPLVVDCNAVAPATVRTIGDTIASSGARFVDGSIIGLPPGTAETPRLYVSGPDANVLRQLDGRGLAVKVMGDQIGQASGIKMCYAGLTKATFALQYAVAMTAEQLGLLEPLLAEFAHSQGGALAKMEQGLPRIPAKALRWVGEMEEIAQTLAAEGITSRFHEGAADIFRRVSQSALGSETPETVDSSRTLEETIKALAHSTDGQAWGRGRT